MGTNPLELLVRPNQTADFRPLPGAPRLAQVGDETKNDNVVVSWGGTGDSIFTIARPPFGFKVEDDKQETERTYDVVRVKNPDDPDQYVDTEVMTEWKARNKIDSSRTTLRFASPTSSQTTEVISRGNKRSSST